MSKYKILAPFLMLTLLLSACNTDTAASTDTEVVIHTVYTAVAMTLTSKADEATVTPTLVPSSTPSPQVSVTSIPTIAPSPTLPYSVISSSMSSACDDSAYINDVTIADGTVLAPGESFTKTWKLQNTGTCTWTTSYPISFVSGSSMSGATTALSSSTSSGGQLNVSVDMVAPSSTGTYTGYWRLENAAGTSFGQSVYVQVVVSTSASTITPTPTTTATESSYTSTPTSTTVASTSTPEPTSTTIPTDIPAPTAIPTNSPEPTAIPTETPAS